MISAKSDSEITFQLMVESAPTSLILVNKEGKIAFSNNQSEKLFGYNKSELIGQSIELLIPARFSGNHQGFRDQFFKAPEARAGGDSRDLFGLKKDGTEFPAEIGLNPIVTVEGTMVLAAVIDITERKKAEKEIHSLNLNLEQNVAENQNYIKELELSSEILKDTERLAHLGSWYINLETYQQAWSDETYHIYGCEVGEVEPSLQSFISFVHPDDLDYVKRMTDPSMIVLNNEIKFNFRIIDKHKNIKYIRNELFVTRNAEGKPIKLTGFNLDITSEEEAKIKLKDSEERYKDIFDNNPMPMFVIDKYSYQFLSVNNAAVKNYGYSIEEFLNMTAVDIRPNEDKARFINLERTQNQSVYDAGNWEHVKKDGTRIQVEIHADSVLFDGKEARLILAIDITEKIKAENELKKSEANLLSILNNTDTAYMLIDKNLEIISFNNISNNFAKVILNKPLKAGKNFLELISDDHKPIVKATLTEVLKGKTIENETNYSYKNIPSKWFFIKYAPISNKEGEIFGVLLSMTDITDRKESFEKLRQSQAHLLASQKIGKTGSWELAIDTENGFDIYSTYLSDQTLDIFGYQGKKITKEIFYDSVHPDDRDLIKTEMLKAIKENKTYQVEHRIIRKNGDIRFVNDIAEVIRNEQTGRSYKILGTTHDITMQKKSELALKKSEANMRSIFENPDISYVLMDKYLNIISFNKRANDGFIRELQGPLVEGKNFLDYVPDERKIQVHERYQGVVHGKSINYESRFNRPDGSVYWLFFQLAPVKDDTNNSLGIIMVITDITEKKSGEVEREKLVNDIIRRNKDLEQFTYIVSHNLRGPLANLIGTADILQMDDLDNEMAKTMLSSLSSSVDRLDEVIKDLNYILQVKREVSEKNETIQFSRIVEDIKISMSNLIKSDHVKIITDFAGIDEIFALKSYIYSVFYNLISNSIKYRRSDVSPIIEIKSVRVKSKIILTFKDNGLGIDLEKKGNQVFGLYKRFHLHKEGKGMGLYMTKTQVETMGGNITVSSKVNEGTEFRIEFDINT